MPVSAPVFAYLGPAGTYTHEAARAFAARLGIDEPAPSRMRVVRRGVRLPWTAANASSAWWRRRTRSKGRSRPRSTTSRSRAQASILGEHVLDIHHCLVLHPDAKLEDVDLRGLARAGPRAVPSLPGRAAAGARDRHHVVHRRERAAWPPRTPHVAGIANAFAAELHGARVADARHRGPFRQPDVVRAHRPPGTSARVPRRPLQDLARAVLAGGPRGHAEHDPVGVRLRRHQPVDDPVAPHEAGARRLHVLHRVQGGRERPCPCRRP